MLRILVHKKAGDDGTPFQKLEHIDRVSICANAHRCIWTVYRTETIQEKVLHFAFNTQDITNSTLVCPVKIEYVTKNNIFGLKMMMKSGLEKIFLNSSMRSPCYLYY